MTKLSELEEEELLPAEGVVIRRETVPFTQSIYRVVWSIQFFSMLLLTAQQTGMPFLVRAANKSHFLPTTSVFMMEILKLILCFILIWKSNGSFFGTCQMLHESIWNNKIETLKVSVPAIVYAIQNNLYYIALANIDATTYSVTYQLRILTTAILSVCILNSILSIPQWGSLLLALGGVALVQYDQSDSHKSSNVDGDKMYGVLATIAMCWTSAFAGVYFEKILKKYKTDMWTQNIRLGLLTLVFATFTMIASDAGAIAVGGLFQGWTWLVWLVTVLNSIGGLAVSMVMKYADNVKKTYCQTIAIGLTAVISIFLGDRPFSLLMFEGVTLVIVAVLVFTFYPPKKLKALADLEEAIKEEQLEDEKEQAMKKEELIKMDWNENVEQDKQHRGKMRDHNNGII
ncbi:hypothetical protein WR25_23133 [Diploscapter pachys]|uniref:Uncharacterized protein n=1 Tax=Diploscapter pachys TaxID=2018661 RepID=A0A2A2JGC1_9BILA|nr:hypothetical protein WR25_23133 [Diploscapter pachys]